MSRRWPPARIHLVATRRASAGSGGSSLNASEARTEYAARLERWNERAARHGRAERWLSNGRLVVFLVAAVCTVWVMRFRPEAWLTLPLLYGLFAVLVPLHGRARHQRDRARRAVRWYERGFARLEDRWQDAAPDGSAYLDPGHPFARDLNLFGPASMFQRLCTTRTRLGEDTLAAWLTQPGERPVSAAAIRDRQEAVGSLKPDVDLREELALLDAKEGDVHLQTLVDWAQAEPVRIRAAERIVAVVLAILAVGAVVGWALGFGLSPLLLVAALEAIFGQWMRGRMGAITRRVESVAGELAMIGQLLALVERRHSDAGRLAELREAVHQGGHTASWHLARLGRLLRVFGDARYNLFFSPVAFLLQLRVHLARAVEEWRRTVGTSLVAWLDAAGEFEVLCALATYAYERPADTFPELVEHGVIFKAQALGHPLIPEHRCVRNDIRLDDQCRLLLISGSNMSGKTTLIGAVGVNAVLALAGAPVQAEQLTLSPFFIGASIEIRGSLSAGRSQFFAEIGRLKLIKDMAEGPRPTLFLLDEILRGTNSLDRRVGAWAVLRKLVELGAVGLVTTHDLALTDIADEVTPQGRNVHFEDQLVDGKLVFDYRLRDGVVQHGNALALMRAQGLDV